MIRAILNWSVERPVVANLLMVFLLVVGGISAWNMRREIFPEFSLDMVQVSVIYKGASVEEIEESIVTKIEEEITGIEGIKKITSTAVEGLGTVTVELETGTNVNRALNDVKNAVDQIDTFPQESERPLTVEVVRKIPVIKVAVYGDLPEHVLTGLAEEIKNELLAIEGITQAELFGNREYEISIEISESNLRKYGLTLTQVADLIKRNSLDLPGGTLRADTGQILVRTKGRLYTAKEFEDLVVMTKMDGTVVRLNRIAKITESFEEVDLQARMDGKPAILVSVSKTSKQDAVDIARKVREFVREKNKTLPPAVKLAVWDDTSVFIKSRLDLMIRNGAQGLVLVMIILALFLRLRVAFWVAMGIPISMMGSFVFLGISDYTLNMISMYAFIVVLGIVVDDAIVVGENVYTHMDSEDDPIKASVEGTEQIAYPVINAVATTIVAFAPMLFVSGVMGKFMSVFPVAIIAVLLVSLAEVFVILPAHLAHMKHVENETIRWNPFVLVERVRGRVQRGLNYFIDRLFFPALQWVITYRYVFVSVVLALLILSVGLFVGGRLSFVFFPKVDSDEMACRLILRDGTSFNTTNRAVKRIEEAAWELEAKYSGKDEQPIIKHMFALVGGQVPGRGMSQESGSHAAHVIIELLESSERGIPSTKLSSEWRDLVGEIPDTISLTYEGAHAGPTGGSPIEVGLLGNDMDALLGAAAAIKAKLGTFAGVEDIEDSYRSGKQELRLSLKEGARQLGISLADLARQTRASFWGEEALKIQRGRNEVTIRIRYPEEERLSPGDLENMRVRAPDGSEVPFLQVASVEPYRGPAHIHRKYGRRTVTVMADVDEKKANAFEVVSALKADFFPELKRQYPGVDVIFEGQEKERKESMTSLFQGLAVALFLIFVLLVNMFRTYTHPLIIMTAIPFSFIGIVAGHMLFRIDFTILSMFGVLALAGIVVNDSLLLIEASNREEAKGLPLKEALINGARNRFRQILLTTLSTAAGLTPILLETSFQAQFLKPMTITVVFGLIAATALILLFVPAVTMIRDDIRRLFNPVSSPKTDTSMADHSH